MTEVQQFPTSNLPSLAEGIEECWIDCEGARLRYLRAGSGPPLILLHGLFAYSFSWRFTLPALAPYATVYALDMLGAGFSDRPRGIDHSMRATALRVLQFVEQLGLSSFDLLGTSRGGAVAMCAAGECVDRKSGPRLRRLILVCPVNPYSPHGRWMAPVFATPFGAAGFRWATGRIPSIAQYVHARLFADRSKIPPDSLAGYRAPTASPDFYEHALSIARSWTADLEELQRLLPKLRHVPTLLAWGTEDPAVYVSSLEPLAKHFANVQKVVFAGIGHVPYEECPDEFNRALIKFLTQ